MTEYANILKPIRIGSHIWKNRVVKGPSSTLFFGPDQFCNDTAIGPYEAMAKGGAAAVIVGAMLSDDPGMLIEKENDDVYPYGYRGYPFGGLYDDKFISGLTEFTGAVHAYGCEAIAQIFQNGAALETRGGSWCASTVAEKDLPSPVPGCYPTRGLSVEEIQEFKDRYFAAAQRAQSAGFDGVEVHAGNGYLIASFLTRVWNHREDEYGFQSFENRTRLARELIMGIKERCGTDFIVGVRMNGQEFGHPDGNTLDESAEMAKLLEAAGADYLSVTGYGYGPHPMQYANDFWMTPEPNEDMEQYRNRIKDGIVVAAAENVKRNVSIPVFGVGTLTPESADRFIGESRFDVGLFARGLWADPAIANKLAAGHPEDIRRCNRCGTCEELGTAPNRRRCRVNPQFGRERELEVVPAVVKKKVLVAGGGVAGIRAATILAERGHEVVLCEKSSSLTSTLNVATMVKGVNCEKVPYLIDYLHAQIKKYPNLNVKMKTEVTRELALSMKPDAIVVATGGSYASPNIPGIDLRIVQTVPGLKKIAEKPLKIFGASNISQLSKIALPMIGKRCVILGSQLEGIQGAVFLRERGKQVTIIDETEGLNSDGRLPGRYADRDLPWLERAEVKVITGVKLKEVDKRGLTYEKDGIKTHVDADSVLVFMPPIEAKGLYEQLKDCAPEVYAVGSINGSEHSLMVDAMREGFEVSVSI